MYFIRLWKTLWLSMVVVLMNLPEDFLNQGRLQISEKLVLKCTYVYHEHSIQQDHECVEHVCVILYIEGRSATEAVNVFQKLWYNTTVCVNELLDTLGHSNLHDVLIFQHSLRGSLTKDLFFFPSILTYSELAITKLCLLKFLMHCILHDQ